MPELPDIELYLHALRPRVIGEALESARLFSPSLLRTVAPPLTDAIGKRVIGLSRLGKRIVFQFDSDLFLVIHLMIAGRFLWDDAHALAKREQPLRPGGKSTLAAFSFPTGRLLLTEQGTKRRAALSLFQGERALMDEDPGGIDPLAATPTDIGSALGQDRRTVKRLLTDPHVFSGIGNAYSDEILFAARVAPNRSAESLSEDERLRIGEGTLFVLREWTERLQMEFGSSFPGRGKVTAFRPDFAVHGRFGLPCRVCSKPVQRVRYADNESNYCAICQNGGRLIPDRALSKLLKGDWPTSLVD